MKVNAPPAPKTRLLTADEVADQLAVTKSWVHRAARDGHLPSLKLGRFRRFDPAAIDAMIATHGSSTNAS